MVGGISLKRLILILALVFVGAGGVMAALPATIQEMGTWDGLSSFQVILGTVKGENVRICLPTVHFNSKINKEKLQQELRKGIAKQDAIFNLYHDGVGRPKKQGGMYYASDVFLRDLKMTYTGYLSKLGYKFTVSNKPAYEDQDTFKDIVYSQSVAQTKKEQDERKAAVEAKKKKAKRREKPPTRRIETIYDILPPGVIPPRTRKEIAEINRRIEAMKNQPYTTKNIEVDPVRWARGVCGLLKENGEITGAVVEGRKLQLAIRVPKQKGWLTVAMIKELEGANCEFMLQRDRNGREVVENGHYLIRDFYLYDAKISYEEWLEKHNIDCPEFVQKENYAEQPIVIDTEYLTGTWGKTMGLAVAGVVFPQKTKLVNEKELIRVFPIKNRPKGFRFRNFAAAFDKKYANAKIGITLMVCQDGVPYTELGQKRALRIYFSDETANLDMLQEELANKK